MRYVVCLTVLLAGCSSLGGDLLKPAKGKLNPARGRAQFAVIRARAFLENPEFEREYGRTPSKPQPQPKPQWDNEFSDRIRVPQVGSEAPVRDVIRVMAPRWCVPANEFRKWYDAQTPEQLAELPFDLEIVPDDEIPTEVAVIPSFDWDGGHVADWVDIDTLVAQYHETRKPQAFSGQKKRDRDERRDDKKHDDDLPELPAGVGYVNGLDVLPDIIGDGLTLVRTARSDIKIPSSYGSHILIPTNTQLTARHVNGVTTVTIDQGSPKLIFPLKLWSIAIKGATLVGNQLTVQLDGWKDYTVVINWGA